MNIKATGKIRHNGKDYKAGDVIPGLSEKEYDRLIELNVGEEVEGTFDENAGNGNGNDGDFSDFQMNGGVVLTVDEFSELKADDQKAHLKALEIEPAGKEEDRITQYEEWYAEQLTADDQN